jgi:hypothetical protein
VKGIRRGVGECRGGKKERKSRPGSKKTKRPKDWKHPQNCLRQKLCGLTLQAAHCQALVNAQEPGPGSSHYSLFLDPRDRYKSDSIHISSLPSDIETKFSAEVLQGILAMTTRRSRYRG